MKKTTVKKKAAPETPQACGMSQCFSPCLLVAALLVSIYSFGFDWVVNGMLFGDLFALAANLMRPMETMQQFFPFCIIAHIAVAYLITKGFFKWRSKLVVGAVGSCDCPYRKAMGFGMWIGMILGISWGSAYIYQPIPEKLALVFLLSPIVKWMVGGLLLSKLYDWKAKKSA